MLKNGTEMNVLILSKRLSLKGEDPWLIDDLAECFSARGFHVVIALVDLSGQWPKGITKRAGITILSYPIKKGNKIRKLLSLVIANLWLVKEVVKHRSINFEFLLGYSVVSVFLPFLFFYSFFKNTRKKLLFLWDFFPIHHQEIGGVKSKTIAKVLYRLENFSVRFFDCVGLMSEKNKLFFDEYHPNYSGSKCVIPVWGKDRRLSSKGTLQNKLQDGLDIVFGGQLVKGRGVDAIIELSEIIEDKGNKIRIHVFGGGELSERIRGYAESSKVLIYYGLVAREEYLECIKRFDLGLIVTVPNVSIPSFPSKVIDYFVCSKPVLACVEKTTDFGDVIENNAKAGVYADAGSVIDIYEKVVYLESLKNTGELGDLGNNGRSYFLKKMEVNAVLDLILKELYS
jgi:glycosyltransferase involved in cell wall biosynthesis